MARPVHTPAVEDAPGNIDFDGLVNARDVGGLPVTGGGAVRRGVLFRSETPELMTDADVARAIDDLGVRRTIDLRGPRGRPYPLGDGGGRVSIDFFALVGDHDRSQAGFLPSLLTRGGAVMGPVIESILDADGPCLVHCHTGKDRTGFVIAMLLALVGVPDEHIIADYERSTPVYETMVANLAAAGRGVPPNAPNFALMPPSTEGIAELLVGLRAGWPSARAYLESQGVAPDLLDRVIGALTEV